MRVNGKHIFSMIFCILILLTATSCGDGTVRAAVDNGRPGVIYATVSVAVEGAIVQTCDKPQFLYCAQQ